MIRALKRWREKRAAERERIAACDAARKQGDDLVAALMAGRAPDDTDEWFHNLEADTFHEECGDR